MTIEEIYSIYSKQHTQSRKQLQCYFEAKINYSIYISMLKTNYTCYIKSTFKNKVNK